MTITANFLDAVIGSTPSGAVWPQSQIVEKPLPTGIVEQFDPMEG
jgi:hypothetical protein